jgi:hypothetical protein
MNNNLTDGLVQAALLRLERILVVGGCALGVRGLRIRIGAGVMSICPGSPLMENRMRYVLLMLVLLTTGCVANRSSSGSAAPADDATLAGIRGDFARAGVNATVAAVTEVLTDQPFLAASASGAWDFPVGSTITVSDTNLNTLAHGRVVALVGSDVHASFVVTGSRSPRPGDIVVRFP